MTIQYDVVFFEVLCISLSGKMVSRIYISFSKFYLLILFYTNFFQMNETWNVVFENYSYSFF
jgi:hypothetical protein